MQRIKDYLRFLTWQAGLGYIALWAITYWTLDAGMAVFGRSGVCRPDAAKVLFYWVCDPASPLAMLATVSNVALTATVWAPVYVAAATVRPDAIAIALPIVLVHVIGLPTAMFVLVRLMVRLFDAMHLMLGRTHAETAAGGGAAPATPAIKSVIARRVPAEKPIKLVKPRGHFGLRSRNRR